MAHQRGRSTHPTRDSVNRRAARSQACSSRRRPPASVFLAGMKHGGASPLRVVGNPRRWGCKLRYSGAVINLAYSQGTQRLGLWSTDVLGRRRGSRVNRKDRRRAGQLRFTTSMSSCISSPSSPDIRVETTCNSYMGVISPPPASCGSSIASRRPASVTDAACSGGSFRPTSTRRPWISASLVRAALE